MGTLSKVLGFSLALTLVFTGVANLLPQVEGEPPKEEKVDLGALTMDSFIAWGNPPSTARAPVLFVITIWVVRRICWL